MSIWCDDDLSAAAAALYINMNKKNRIFILFFFTSVKSAPVKLLDINYELRLLYRFV